MSAVMMLFGVGVLITIAMVFFSRPFVPDSNHATATNTRRGVSLATRPTPAPPIAYEEIWRGREQTGGMNRHYLVSPTSTKEEVLRLAAYLKERAQIGRYVFIEIWDSAEAHRRRSDDSYPASQVFKHHLVSVVVNPTTGLNETQWTAEGR